jgi:DNA-binding Xre family transcriptional regulator
MKGKKLMLVYRKFFKMESTKNLNINELRDILSPRTVYRLESGGEISAYIINKICSAFKCQPGDFMEYIDD